MNYFDDKHSYLTCKVVFGNWICGDMNTIFMISNGKQETKNKLMPLAKVYCAVKSYTQHINEGLVLMLSLSSHSLFLSLVSMATGGHLLHCCFRLSWSQTLVIMITSPFWEWHLNCSHIINACTFIDNYLKFSFNFCYMHFCVWKVCSCFCTVLPFFVVFQPYDEIICIHFMSLNNLEWKSDRPVTGINQLVAQPANNDLRYSMVSGPGFLCLWNVHVL